MADEDWADEFDVGLPLGQLRIQAHDLFDPIWRDDRSTTRRGAYQSLAFLLGVPEPLAHFKNMPRFRILRAIKVIPDLRRDLKEFNRLQKR